MKKREFKYDVIVAGGGVAGVSAALSASRENKKVALIERTPVLGGLATIGLINWFEPFCDGLGHQIIYSQCEELFRLAIKYGYKTVDEAWLNGGTPERRFSSWFDHNLFSLSLTKLLTDNHIDIYFETQISDVVKEGDNISELIAYNVEGELHFKGKYFIDATGSAYLCRAANLSCHSGENYLTYATTTYKNGVGKPVFQYSGSGLDGKKHPQGLHYFNGNVTEDVNEYLIKAQRLCLDEYEQGIIKDVSMVPGMIQFRKISALDGEYQLTEKDLYVHHDDSIAAIGVFNRPGQWYEIPMGCLYSKKINNLFVAGRNISANGEGWEAVRVIPICILTGEIAGLMTTCHQLNVQELQQKVIKRGIKIHY